MSPGFEDSPRFLFHWCACKSLLLTCQHSFADGFCKPLAKASSSSAKARCFALPGSSRSRDCPGSPQCSGTRGVLVAGCSVTFNMCRAVVGFGSKAACKRVVGKQAGLLNRSTPKQQMSQTQVMVTNHLEPEDWKTESGPHMYRGSWKSRSLKAAASKQLQRAFW